VALFKALKALERLSVLVDGESLLNDAAAIVRDRAVLSVMKAAAVGPMTAVHGAVDFVLVSAGGVVVGTALAVVCARVVRLAEDDPLVEIALSMVLAYTAFVVTD
jgi:CPA1 family monovalent cation:H+ antiporter